jgi:hypothetical protein
MAMVAVGVMAVMVVVMMVAVEVMTGMSVMVVGCRSLAVPTGGLGEPRPLRPLCHHGDRVHGGVLVMVVVIGVAAVVVMTGMAAMVGVVVCPSLAIPTGGLDHGGPHPPCPLCHRGDPVYGGVLEMTAEAEVAVVILVVVMGVAAMS